MNQNLATKITTKRERKLTSIKRNFLTRTLSGDGAKKTLVR